MLLAYLVRRALVSFKFGKNSPRSLDSFGVAGLLEEESTVLYEGLFATTHTGRVSDLISARFLKSGADEVKLRMILTFSVFQSYRAQLSKEQWVVNGEEKLKEPLIIECGIDEEKLAVGVSFHCKTGNFINKENLKERLNSGNTESPFEEMVLSLRENSDRIIIKILDSQSRIEIISLLGLPDKLNLEEDSDSSDIEVLVLDKESVAPKVKNYIELGDLDYPELLKEENLAANIKPESMGKIVSEKISEKVLNFRKDETKVKGSSDEDDSLQVAVKNKLHEKDLETIKVKGTQAEVQTETVVSGQNEESTDEAILVKDHSKESKSDEKIVVKGSKEDVDKEPIVVKDNQVEESNEEVIRIKGAQKENGLDEEKIVIKGSASEDDQSGDDSDSLDNKDVEELESIKAQHESELEELRKKINDIKKEGNFEKRELLYRQQMDVLQEKIKSLQDRLAKKELLVKSSISKASEEQPQNNGWLTKTFGKIWPFKKQAESETKESNISAKKAAEVEVDYQDDGEPFEIDLVESSKDKEEDIGPVGDPKVYAQDLMLTAEGGNLDRAIRGIRKDAINMKSDIRSPKVKKWVEAIVASLESEKNRIKSLTKKLNQSVRQKELEFKTKERTLQEELRRKDTTIRQKDNSIAQAKDQTSQLQMKIERLKSAKNDASKDAMLKKKFDHLQGLYDGLQKEYDKFKKISNAQRSAPAINEKEFLELREKLNKSTREVQELKKQRESLASQASTMQQQQELTSTKVKEMKAKLDKALKIVNAAKEENEKLKKQLEDSKSSDSAA